MTNAKTDWVKVERRTLLPNRSATLRALAVSQARIPLSLLAPQTLAPRPARKPRALPPKKAPTRCDNHRIGSRIWTLRIARFEQ
jgi:hypothetical protein